MTLIETEIDDTISVIRLNNEITNPINPKLVHDLSSELQGLKDDPEVHALVLTSSTTKFFSIGLAIPELFPMDRDAFSGFIHSFNQLCIDLFSFPKPTIAAINGHAIAGGCVLALCFDYRFIARERKLMGLNEIRLGVPVPSPADAILRSLVGTRISRDILESGEFFGPEQALAMGLVDEVHPLESLQDKACEKARVLGSMPSRAYHHAKWGRIEPLLEGLKEQQEEKERFFVDCWFNEDTRVRLKEAMEKF